MTIGIIYRFKGIDVYENKSKWTVASLINIQNPLIRSTVQKFCQIIRSILKLLSRILTRNVLLGHCLCFFEFIASLDCGKNKHNRHHNGEHNTPFTYILYLHV